eukprot:1381290-Pyramimonas_sp.AAC.1
MRRLAFQTGCRKRCATRSQTEVLNVIGQGMKQNKGGVNQAQLPQRSTAPASALARLSARLNARPPRPNGSQR